MQPTFLPWQGYFGLVAAAEVFVLLDDFQFQRHSFQQRNRIRLADGAESWISLPVAHPAGEFPTLAQAAPVVDAKWRRPFSLLRRCSIFSVKSPRQKTWITTFIAINGRLQAQSAFHAAASCVFID